MKAIQLVKSKGTITNTEYQELTAVSKATAYRELAALVRMQLLSQQGTTGRGTYYILYRPSETKPFRRQYDLIPDKAQRMKRHRKDVVDLVKSELQKLIDEQGNVNIDQIVDEFEDEWGVHFLEEILGELLDTGAVTIDEHGYYHVVR